MMDDELLKLAAKAAGIKLEYSPGIGWGYWTERDFVTWHPRDDDGDSRRLEVACDLAVMQLPADGGVGCRGFLRDSGAAVQRCELYSDHRDDKSAATRVAVLRVAAEIGRRMPWAIGSA